MSSDNEKMMRGFRRLMNPQSHDSVEAIAQRLYPTKPEERGTYVEGSLESTLYPHDHPKPCAAPLRRDGDIAQRLYPDQARQGRGA